MDATGEVRAAPPALSRIEQSERLDYFDPEAHVARLPQPWRMINRILGKLVDRALEVADERRALEEARLKQKDNPHLPIHFPYSSFGNDDFVTCSAGAEDRVVFFGSRGGAVVAVDPQSKSELGRYSVVETGPVISLSIAFHAHPTQPDRAPYIVVAACAGTSVLVLAFLDNVFLPFAQIELGRPIDPACTLHLAGDMVHVGLIDPGSNTIEIFALPEAPFLLDFELDESLGEGKVPAGNASTTSSNKRLGVKFSLDTPQTSARRGADSRASNGPEAAAIGAIPNVPFGSFLFGRRTPTVDRIAKPQLAIKPPKSVRSHLESFFAEQEQLETQLALGGAGRPGDKKGGKDGAGGKGDKKSKSGGKASARPQSSAGDKGDATAGSGGAATNGAGGGEMGGGVPPVPHLHFVLISRRPRRKLQTTPSGQFVGGSRAAAAAAVSGNRMLTVGMAGQGGGARDAAAQNQAALRTAAIAVVVWWSGINQLCTYSLLEAPEDPGACTPAKAFTLPNFVTASAMEQSGRLLATGLADGGTIVWDSVLGTEIFLLSKHAGAVDSIAFHRRSHLVTGSSDCRMHIYDLGTGELLFSKGENTEPIKQVMCLGETPLTVTVTVGHQLRLYNIRDGTNVAKLDVLAPWQILSDSLQCLGVLMTAVVADINETETVSSGGLQPPSRAGLAPSPMTPMGTGMGPKPDDESMPGDNQNVAVFFLGDMVHAGAGAGAPAPPGTAVSMQSTMVASITSGDASKPHTPLTVEALLRGSPSLRAASDTKNSRTASRSLRTGPESVDDGDMDMDEPVEARFVAHAVDPQERVTMHLKMRQASRNDRDHRMMKRKQELRKQVRNQLGLPPEAAHPDTPVSMPRPGARSKNRTASKRGAFR